MVNSGTRVLEASGSLYAVAGDSVTLSADTVSVRLNETGIAYTGVSIAAGELVYTFGTMEASSTLLEVAIGNANVSVGGFVQISGNVAVHMDTQSVKPTGESALTADLLTIGGSDLSAFAGYSGGTDYAIGLQLSGVDFALALMSEEGGSQRSWTALQGSVAAPRWWAFPV